VTEQEQKRYYAQALESLSVIRRDVAWLVPAVARIEERDCATERRLGVVETWCSDKDDEVSATGQHRIAAVEDTMRRMAEQRRHYTRYAIATGVGLVTSGLLTWVGIALAGCG